MTAFLAFWHNQSEPTPILLFNVIFLLGVRFFSLFFWKTEQILMNNINKPSRCKHLSQLPFAFFFKAND